MGSSVLASETTTNLKRNTAHQQYQGRAFGVMVLNHLVPIILNVRQPGGHNQRSLLVFGGDKTQRFIPFSDLGWITKDCIRVFNFNIRHYITCYLPEQAGSNGDPTIPYQFNLCQKCGVAVSDDSGRLIHQIIKRRYRGDMYVYTPKKSLQSDTGIGDIFNYQERAVSCKSKM